LLLRRPVAALVVVAAVALVALPGALPFAGSTQAAEREPASGPGVVLEPVDLAAVMLLAANQSRNLRLINVWATWCAPCLAELPVLVELDREYRERGLEIVTLSIDALDQREEPLEFLTGIDAQMRNTIVGPDDPRALARALDPEWVGPVPYTVLIAPGGEVKFRKIGTFVRDELVSAIEAELPVGGLR